MAAERLAEEGVEAVGEVGVDIFWFGNFFGGSLLACLQVLAPDFSLEFAGFFPRD